MDNNIEKIRDEERKYHEACYDNYNLFEAGSWLHKPVQSVMDYLALFDSRVYLSVLDLGCGVGRNSIPIAETLKNRDGKVVCVDLIEKAISKLIIYSQEYSVSKYIETHLSDIGNYTIAVNEYDYIIAVSALEHIRNELEFIDVLDRMVIGTKNQGINCIIMNTNIKEIDIITGEYMEPMMELNMSTEQAEGLIFKAYNGWNIIYTTVKSLEFNIERNESKILLQSDCLTYIIQKNF